MNAADLSRLSHDQLVAHVRRSVDVTGHYVADRRVPAARIEVYPKRRPAVRAHRSQADREPVVCGTVVDITPGPSYADFFAPAAQQLATA
ncbi:hypothetical protein [Frigoribacterium sp. RIT-PI-h]|uniref:hypothetical protein n=1 Tax=Frigoribacterium sp. RIT-PI-h TaxID=1690245 RepID=UPI0006B99187|nr:hypothetical protein [Frigoribacterium sp. RIT-PI-h]KPG84560.1 hypothetical protein AEQ27_06545 [Frigoribacterium sp. RIT-PI-h]